MLLPKKQISREIDQEKKREGMREAIWRCEKGPDSDKTEKQIKLKVSRSTKIAQVRAEDQ